MARGAADFQSSWKQHSSWFKWSAHTINQRGGGGTQEVKRFVWLQTGSLSDLRGTGLTPRPYREREVDVYNRGGVGEVHNTSLISHHVTTLTCQMQRFVELLINSHSVSCKSISSHPEHFTRTHTSHLLPHGASAFALTHAWCNLRLAKPEVKRLHCETGQLAHAQPSKGEPDTGGPGHIGDLDSHLDVRTYSQNVAGKVHPLFMDLVTNSDPFAERSTDTTKVSSMSLRLEDNYTLFSTLRKTVHERFKLILAIKSTTKFCFFTNFYSVLISGNKWLSINNSFH